MEGIVSGQREARAGERWLYMCSFDAQVWERADEGRDQGRRRVVDLE